MFSFLFFLADDKNPDVVPQENSDDEFISEEKAFDRLNLDTHRIVYSPARLTTTPPSISPTGTITPTIGGIAGVGGMGGIGIGGGIGSGSIGSIGFTAMKPFGELSLTTNPAYALYNSPQHRPTFYSSPQTTPLLTTTSTNSNIYTRIPTRSFTPYDTKISPVSSNYGCTIPLLLQNHSNASTLNKNDKKS